MKLILVSNRLPVAVREQEGELHFSESPGGLASGLRSYLRSPQADLSSEYVWVGWPGTAVRPELQEEVARRCRQEFSAQPVFLSREDTEAFYEGFCNETLWPLFHYFTSLVSYNEASWAPYERTNQVFCDAVLEVVEPDDLVWIHDYHFLRLPVLLRQRLPHLRIGFFLHIPFPSYEIFRLLPDRWRSALLSGLLGADLVGFHTHDYTQHFLKCIRRILGYEHEMGRVVVEDRVVKADTFPMGVEFETFSGKARQPEVQQMRDQLRQPFAGCSTILSIDRLDYSKGIANRLKAYLTFLEANADWHGKVVLLMVVVPSRTGVEEYQKMKTRIDELVGRINGKFGSLTWTPVLYQYKSFPQEELVPLYNASDVMLVTPLRDGMNLVAKEYIASRADERGVLILSEMTGAASELGEAVIVNPNDISGMAEALKTALESPLDVQQSDMAAMRNRLRRYDVVRWAGDFLDGLRDAHSYRDQRHLGPAVLKQLVEDFRSAQRRLLLCDYDGTLVPLRPTPELARPDPNLLRLLGVLTRQSEVVIVSGRARATMESWFSGLDVSLVAEHGVWVRSRKQDWIRTGLFSTDWKAKIRDLMELYVDRLPGARVEEKEYTLAWHYRRADPDLAALRARELADHLISLTETSELKVIEGNKVIEVRPSAMSKGTACLSFLAAGPQFVLALGDDTTDEDLFKVLPAASYSIRIGRVKSQARFMVYTQAEARALLQTLAEMAS